MGFLDIGPGKTKEGLQTNAEQQSAMHDAIRQQQDSMKSWFNDTSLGQTLEPLQTFGNDMKQQGEALKQQGQDWFMQTAPGQVVSDFKIKSDKSLNKRTDTANRQYQSDISKIYQNAMKKLGIL